MSDWRERVIVERDELKAKLDKLTDFLYKDDQLDDNTRWWLLRQKLVMTEYVTILTCRLMQT